MERLHAVVHGHVQGVGFRYFVQRRASELGLSGWVRNNDDGTVEAVAEGPRETLEQGPRSARVERVDATWSVATGGLDAFDLAW